MEDFESDPAPTNAVFFSTALLSTIAQWMSSLDDDELEDILTSFGNLESLLKNFSPVKCSVGKGQQIFLIW